MITSTFIIHFTVGENEHSIFGQDISGRCIYYVSWVDHFKIHSIREQES